MKSSKLLKMWSRAKIERYFTARGSRQVPGEPFRLGIHLSVVLATVLLALPWRADAAELKPETVAAFDRYASATEARINAELAHPPPLLWVDGLADAQRQSALAELRAGHVYIARLGSNADKPIKVPGGLIHHWIGTVFIPGATLDRTLQLVEDYDHHQDYYHPDVQRSKILSRSGDDFRVYLRFYKKKILTSVLDTEHDIHYQRVSATRAWSRSKSTRIAEVDDPGESDEHDLQPGHDRGFLWRIYTWWRFEEKDGGTYVECQSVSLTRDIPTGLGWLVGPFVNSIPRESLTFTLEATRRALVPAPAKTK